MLTHVRAGFALTRLVLHRMAIFAIVAMAVGLLGYTVACGLGLAPWLMLPMTFGETIVPEAGIYVQLAATAIMAVMCFYLPSNARIMALENSHRSFQLGMRDVAKAYALAHSADREGVFKLKGEFDSIRERISFLRDHPDLAEIEPSVLEMAAQMSHVSQELATVYSDSAVSRARDFLIARQQEVETFNDRLSEAKAVALDMRQWVDRVEMEETVAKSQLDRLREELYSIVPEAFDRNATLDFTAKLAEVHEDAVTDEAVALERAVANITKFDEARAAE